MNSLQNVMLSQNKVKSTSKKKIPEIVIFFASIWSFGVEALIGGFKELTEIDSFFNDMAKEMHISFPKRCGIFDIQIDFETLKNRIIKRSLEEGREDDNINVIETRYNEYLNSTQQVSNIYKDNYPSIFYEIDGSQQIQEITKKIRDILKKS